MAKTKKPKKTTKEKNTSVFTLKGFRLTAITDVGIRLVSDQGSFHIEIDFTLDGLDSDTRGEFEKFLEGLSLNDRFSFGLVEEDEKK